MPLPTLVWVWGKEKQPTCDYEFCTKVQIKKLCEMKLKLQIRGWNMQSVFHQFFPNQSKFVTFMLIKFCSCRNYPMRGNCLWISFEYQMAILLSTCSDWLFLASSFFKRAKNRYFIWRQHRERNSDWQSEKGLRRSYWCLKLDGQTRLLRRKDRLEINYHNNS